VGTFIEITLDRDRIAPEVARSLVTLCPVEIFAWDGNLQVNPEQEDECTLCDLCVNAVPAGAITIHKLYKRRGP
jgi:NAD-dependent dihydropyrimidine dehydrogenase PreA subunit